MLATRIIPTILSKNGQLVKGKGFACDRVVGNALQAARIHAMRGVDEIMLLDVTATKEYREPNYAMIRRLADGCFSPLTVGGGVRKERHVRELLNAGADKVCIGSDKIDLLPKLSDKFGSQCITVSFDIETIEEIDYHSIRTIVSFAKKIEECGAGEILLQSRPKDGTIEGYDLDIIGHVSSSVSVPVIASGGCSGYNDMHEAIKAGASAVAAGALFQFTSATPKGAAEYLHEKGVEVRI